MQEGVCNRLVAAKGANEENTKRHAGKMEKKNVFVWPSKGEHVEVFKVASLISSVLLLVQL